MKYILFVIIFSFIPFTAYTQYLTKNDIDIFIKRYNEFEKTIFVFGAYDEKIWDDYILCISNFFKAFTPFIDDELDNIEIPLENCRNAYLELINYTNIPKELDEAFNNAGWKSNGNKIFWTIYFGFNLLWLKQETDSSIINKNLDKLFYLINARDRNIIKTHFNELKKAYDFSE